MAAQEPTPPNLTFVYSMEAELANAIPIKNIPDGKDRQIIPITGGWFKGPRVSGKILNIGADWLLVDSQGKGRPDTRYVLQTDQGEIIYVRTEGVPPKIANGPNMLRAKFETSTNSSVAWMNNIAAVAVLRVKNPNAVLIDMWEASPAQ
ncbi:uncharacterized protein SETTUDRAFT_21573 [Exserohilum turcica Et28A]|uniref:Uncharacterized protein n=1 Tax=Exserohilum turcicum (strain 28A) TaxID=671987 RepID=R0IG62_EXST2|nr:uncharacterized protein SETTUDRAFT_21573 [Exserohilum turcica Et28A]EOA84215.1 hypothetical protein SETTUDRAFT_21573 [Exserohilum turcica Et28A]